jgi:hypothetical protein
MIKDEQSLFSHCWAKLDFRSDLTDEERATLDTFGERWFQGDNFKPKSAAYVGFLDMCDKYGIKLIRTQRKWGDRPEGLVRYTTPYHINGQEEGSQWPKDRTKKMGDMTPREARAQHRQAERDVARQTKLTPDAKARVEQKIELARLNEQVIPELRAQINELKQTVADLIEFVDDEIEQIKAKVDATPARAVQHYRILDWDASGQVPHLA